MGRQKFAQAYCLANANIIYIYIDEVVTTTVSSRPNPATAPLTGPSDASGLVPHPLPHPPDPLNRGYTKLAPQIGNEPELLRHGSLFMKHNRTIKINQQQINKTSRINKKRGKANEMYVSLTFMTIYNYNICSVIYILYI